MVITGGSETWKKVVKYNEDGWLEDLPDLINGRYYHGCSHYYDGDVLVSLINHMSFSGVSIYLYLFFYIDSI